MQISPRTSFILTAAVFLLLGAVLAWIVINQASEYHTVGDYLHAHFKDWFWLALTAAFFFATLPFINRRCQ